MLTGKYSNNYNDEMEALCIIASSHSRLSRYDMFNVHNETPNATLSYICSCRAELFPLTPRIGQHIETYKKNAEN